MSTPGRRRLNNTIRRLDLRKANRNQHIPALMGTPLNGAEVVEVSNRPNFVYCRLRDNQSELIQAFNRAVAPVYNLPILIRRDELDPSRYEVVDIDRGRYDNWGGSSFVPKHAGQHMFNPDAPGGDIVWAYDRQLMPLLVHPSGTAGACNVVVEPDVYYQDGRWKYGGGTGTPDLCSLKPTDTTAKMVLIYLDSASNPQLSVGSSFASTLTGTVQVMPFVPTLPSTSAVPLAWVRLVSGTSRVMWENLYDARPWIVGDGVLSTGTARHIIQDEGTNEIDRPFLNFVGSTVFVVDDAGNNRTNVIVSGSSGGASIDGHVIQDEGTPVTQRAALNFMGSTVYVVDDGGNNRTNVIVSGSSGGGADFASKAEAEAGVVTDKVISPATLSIIMPAGGLQRTDEDITGNARGDGAADFQKYASNANQVASGAMSFIAAGLYNRNDGYASFMTGEQNVDIGNGSYNFLLGDTNYISGSSTGFMGGADNIAGGANLESPFVYGNSNRVFGVDQAFVTGDGGAAFIYGMEVRTLSGISSGHRQRIMLNLSKQTSNATPVEMLFPNSSRMVLQSKSAWAFTILISAKNTTAIGEGAGYEFKGVIQRDVGVASVALVGSVTKVVLGESDATWDANVDADTTNGSLRIMVTGEASTTISWYASLIAAVSGNS